jgi:hypothetical protein
VQKKAAVLQRQVPAAAEKPIPGAGLAPALVPSVQPQPQTQTTASHALPGANGQPLPLAGKLVNKPQATPAEKTPPSGAEPNAAHHPKTVAQPPLQSANPDARAAPGSKGQPQLPDTNTPADEGQSQIAKTSPEAPNAKLKGGVTAAKSDANGLSTRPAPAIIDNSPAKPNVPDSSEPQAPAPKPQAEPKRQVELKPHAKPKSQAESEPQPQLQPKPATVEQLTKRPPAAEKKKCGVTDLPACP